MPSRNSATLSQAAVADGRDGVVNAGEFLHIRSWCHYLAARRRQLPTARGASFMRALLALEQVIG